MLGLRPISGMACRLAPARGAGRVLGVDRLTALGQADVRHRTDDFLPHLTDDDPLGADDDPLRVGDFATHKQDGAAEILMTP
ncbi:hypothetical protein CF54_10700 [Streptomyces sp. Tu 6176]|nr:hypothetical protein CF54_10700 [Streptomyces sp. Tu 6176]